MPLNDLERSYVFIKMQFWRINIMNLIKKYFFTLSVFFFALPLIIFISNSVNAGVKINDEKAVDKPLIELAILLDTSNSMDGLIEQAKTQLWKIVNELATAKKNGVTPELRVALFEYGKSSLSKSEGYQRKISDFTTDLDGISEELFKLTTNGGDEYCGWTIKSAVETLKWSKGSDNLKLIFIAGNEPFTQGKIDYRSACKQAIEKSIIVNTIFCGNFEQGVSSGWKEY